MADASSDPFECSGIIFDLGGVVLNSPFAAIAEFEQELGCEPNTINVIIQKSGRDGAFAKLERGELTFDNFAEPFARDCERAAVLPVDGLELMRRIASACTPRPLMLDALRVLKESPGVRTAALTNNFIMGEEAGAFADATATVRPLFDVVVESAVEKIRKPDPRIYEVACKRLGVEPHRCVFLDDIGRNLKPAQALGMQTIKCDLGDTTGARALGSLAKLLGERGAGQKLRAALRLAKL